MDSITTLAGIIINPDKCINDVVLIDNDMLILPGGNTWINNENRVHDKTIKTVPEKINGKVIISAICGKTIALRIMVC